MIKKLSPVVVVMLSAFFCWLALYPYMAPSETGEVSGEKIMIINIMYFTLLVSGLFLLAMLPGLFKASGYLVRFLVFLLRIPLLILALVGALFFTATFSFKMPMIALPALSYVATIILFFMTKQHKV